MRQTIMWAVAALLLAGCGRSDVPTTPVVMQGTAVTDAGLTITVTNTSLVPVSQQMGVGGIYARKIWVLVRLRVSNESNRPALCDPMFQLLFLAGREYEPNPLMAEGIHDNSSSAASLDPGSAANVLLAFEVSDAPPFGTYPLQLVVHGDLNSPGAVVNLTSS